MEPININRENADNDREFYEYMERRRQRRLQKLKCEKRKKFIIRIVLCCILGVIVTVLVKNTDKKEKIYSAENTQISEENSIEEPIAELNIAISIKELALANTMGEFNVNESWTEEIPEEVSETETIAQVQTSPFQFEPNSDTVNIYSEEVISTHAVLVNADSGTIVATRGAYDRIIPASMTKVLTVLVAAEAIEEGDLDDTFTMTLEITDYAYVNDCSYVGFLDGEVVTVRDLFYGTVLPSGGDAAVGLATYVAGSQEAFVEMMNAKLEELGLSDSAHFTNCVGLYDANHYCTVYDMAVIMEAAMENELCREVLSAHTYTTSKTTQHPEGIEISNWFLRRIEDKDTGGLVVGAKTGYINESGSCAVSYEEYADGTAYICVTANSTSSWRCIYDHVEIYNQYIPVGE